MTTSGILTVLIIVVCIVAPIMLIPTLGKSGRSGGNLSRAGLMELQNLLEPERKVEILRGQETKQELLVTLDDKGDA